MDCRELGDLIKEKRLQKSLTQKGLADQLHVTDKAVSKWERGLCYPDLSLYELLSDILDIPLDKLVSHKGLNLDRPNHHIQSYNKRITVFIITYISIGLLFCFYMLINPFMMFFIKRIYKLLFLFIYISLLALIIKLTGGKYIDEKM